MKIKKNINHNNDNNVYKYGKTCFVHHYFHHYCHDIFHHLKFSCNHINDLEGIEYQEKIEYDDYFNYDDLPHKIVKENNYIRLNNR